MLEQSTMSIMALQLVENILNKGGHLHNDKCSISKEDDRFVVYRFCSGATHTIYAGIDSHDAAVSFIIETKPFVAIGNAINWYRDAQK